ncbi:MAG: protein kinase, partial [Actinomycetota bacterium]
MLTTNQILQQGRYRIISQLGQNGIGFGYEAFDTVLEANVLLKEIRENLGKVTTSAQLEARKLAFADEAKRLTGIKHESLLQVQDFFSEIDRHYLVTEYIDGNTLGELLEKKNSPFPLADVGNWADRLLDALNYLHTLTPPIFHRQIKPSNIRLSSNGKTKLLVFGIVKSADDKAAMNGANQTLDAAVLPYLPLEQIWDGLDAASQKVILTNYDEKSEKILEQPIDARSDIYALAATLYQLLTARIPIDALTRSIDILEGKSDPLQSPNQLNPSVPREISDVLMKALEIKRENRFSSSVIMRQVLRTAFVRVKEREAKEVNQVKPETIAQVKPDTVTQVKPDTVTQVKPETIAQVKPEEVKQIKQEDEAVLEIPLMQPNPVASPRPPVVVQKSLEIEAEQARQLNFIKQQLREAEE